MVLLTGLAAACSAPTSSPPASGACIDVRAPGVHRDLEALLPLGMIERSPDSLDSGWSCSAEVLATYANHDVHAVRFAGATWDQGNGGGTVVAIFTTPPSEPTLEAAWVEEFYATGAGKSTKTENIEITRPTMPGAGEVWLLETLNDLSLQTLVVWPAAGWPDQPYVHVVIVATTVAPGASREDHDQRVAIAVEVAAGVPIP